MAIGQPIGSSIGRAIGSALAGGGGAAAPFNPLDLMGAEDYWWDASDSSTITETGGKVSQLDDKSGNGNNLTKSTDAKSPLTGETLNGVACIDCRPDKFMVPTVTPFPSAGPCEVFAVIWSDRAATTDNTYILSRPTSSTLNRNILAAKTNFGGTTLIGTAVTRGNGTMRHTLIQHSYTEGSTGTITQYMVIDGRIRSGTSSCTGVYGNSGAFATSTGTFAMNGLFGEMMVFNKTLTAQQREDVLDYLTAKWRALTEVTKYHVVLLAGQSNMRGGYGPVNRTDDLTDPRIAMLERTYNPTTGVVIEDDAGPIVLAEHPLSNRWRDNASPPSEDTVGPGLAYAKALLATLPSDEGVLLVPCAQGATYVMDAPPLSSDVTWSPTPSGGSAGNAPLIDAVDRTNRMLALGHELHSILWCQGENEAARPTMAEATYAGYLDAVVNYLRTEITGATNTPFIAVEIGPFLDGGSFPNAANVNAAINDLPNRLSNCAVVDTSDLTSGGDNVHYDAASARTIGARCWTAYGTI